MNESITQEQQIEVLRNSLMQSIFEKYAALIELLKKMPIDQNLPGIRHAYLEIDTGILWFKEILNTTPLMFKAPTPPAPIPSNDNVTEETPKEEGTCFSSEEKAPVDDAA